MNERNVVFQKIILHTFMFLSSYFLKFFKTMQTGQVLITNSYYESFSWSFICSSFNIFFNYLLKKILKLSEQIKL